MNEDRGPSPAGPETVQSILALRKLTRAVSEALRAQMLEYLATLTPLLRPKAVLGDYVQGGQKEMARRADKAFKDLQTLYEAVATVKPFNLPRELKPPIDLPTTNLEVTPLDYAHVATAGGESRTITVRSPLTWVLTYGGFSPTRFLEVLQTRARQGDEVQRFLLSYLAIHVVVANQPGVAQMLEALHFPITTGTSPEFGDLPLTRIGAAVTTSRPPDEVMLQSANLAGVDAFEEVVNVQDIPMLHDPLRERLLEIVRSQQAEGTHATA